MYPLIILYITQLYRSKVGNETTYSRMDQVKLAEDSLYKFWSDMVCLSKIIKSWSSQYIKTFRL